jgi:hypothetical protein
VYKRCHKKALFDKRHSGYEAGKKQMNNVYAVYEMPFIESLLKHGLFTDRLTVSVPCNGHLD